MLSLVYKIMKDKGDLTMENKDTKTVSVEQEFYTAQEVTTMLGASKTSAYRVIKRLNAELEEKGYITITGKISKRYFLEKSYI
jgi:hypothetical protein